MAPLPPVSTSFAQAVTQYLFVVAEAENMSLFGIHRRWSAGGTVSVVQAFANERDAVKVARKLCRIKSSRKKFPDTVVDGDGKFGGTTMFELMSEDEKEEEEDDNEEKFAEAEKEESLYEVSVSHAGCLRRVRLGGREKRTLRLRRPYSPPSNMRETREASAIDLKILCLPRKMLVGELTRAGIAVQTNAPLVPLENSTYYPPTDYMFYLPYVQDCWPREATGLPAGYPG